MEPRERQHMTTSKSRAAAKQPHKKARNGKVRAERSERERASKPVAKATARSARPAATKVIAKKDVQDRRKKVVKAAEKAFSAGAKARAVRGLIGAITSPRFR